MINICRERIIEYCLPSKDGPLASKSVKDFVLGVAERSAAPGGGSVSALLGALVRFELANPLSEGRSPLSMGC